MLGCITSIWNQGIKNGRLVVRGDGKNTYFAALEG